MCFFCRNIFSAFTIPCSLISVLGIAAIGYNCIMNITTRTANSVSLKNLTVKKYKVFEVNICFPLNDKLNLQI